MASGQRGSERDGQDGRGEERYAEARMGAEGVEEGSVKKAWGAGVGV